MLSSCKWTPEEESELINHHPSCQVGQRFRTKSASSSSLAPQPFFPRLESSFFFFFCFVFVFVFLFPHLAGKNWALIKYSKLNLSNGDSEFLGWLWGKTRGTVTPNTWGYQCCSVHCKFYRGHHLPKASGGQIAKRKKPISAFKMVSLLAWASEVAHFRGQRQAQTGILDLGCT
jgi:hypothetical protein